MVNEMEQAPLLSVFDDKGNETPVLAVRGRDGKEIESFKRVKGDGTPGSEDAYEIKYNDGNVENAVIQNGIDGKDGKDGKSSVDETLSKEGYTVDAQQMGEILEGICPPLNESGPVVQCYPVPDWPIEVKSQLVPKQEGMGDPSPDNIRPIVPYEKAELMRCGVNLADPTNIIKQPKNIRGYAKQNRLNGYWLRAGVTYFWQTNRKADELCIWRFGRTERLSRNTTSVVSYNPEVDTLVEFDAYWTDGRKDTDEAWLTVGSAAPYKSYVSETYTADLPLDTYGGEVDWTGKRIKNECKILDLNAAIYMITNSHGISNFKLPIKNYVIHSAVCSSLPVDNTLQLNVTRPSFLRSSADNIFIRTPGEIKTKEAFLAWCESIKLQVIYKVTDGPTLRLTSSTIPTVLPGLNTFYSSTGNTTVTGLTNPAHEISELKKAVLAKGGNI